MLDPSVSIQGLSHSHGSESRYATAYVCIPSSPLTRYDFSRGLSGAERWTVTEQAALLVRDEMNDE